MATTEARLIALAQTIGADIKSLRASDGTLSSLATLDKTNLVAAINEIYNAVGSAGAHINDAAGTGNFVDTWSANKIVDAISAASTAVKNSLLDGASSAFDTLKELQDALGNDANFATTIAAGLNNRVRFDAAQTLTVAEKTQARSNINAADATGLSNLLTALGDTDSDLVAAYTVAKT